MLTPDVEVSPWPVTTRRAGWPLHVPLHVPARSGTGPAGGAREPGEPASGSAQPATAARRISAVVQRVSVFTPPSYLPTAARRSGPSFAAPLKSVPDLRPRWRRYEQARGWDGSRRNTRRRSGRLPLVG